MLTGPALRFVVNETMLRPNAITPFTRRAARRGYVKCTAASARTRVSSPDHCAARMHIVNASGDRRVRRSSGCSARRGTRSVLSISRRPGEDGWEPDGEEMNLAGEGKAPRAGGRDWRMLVKIVLSAARTVPRRVRKRPHWVKE
jgi:hypothetical protein